MVKVITTELSLPRVVGVVTKKKLGVERNTGTIVVRVKFHGDIKQLVQNLTLSNMHKKKTHPSHKSIDLAGKFELKDGLLKPVLNSSALLNHFMREYCKPGDDFSMKITCKRPRRSVCQNSFLHLYLSLIALSSGHSLEELKAWVKETILAKGIREVMGTSVRIVKSTTDLNISEFAEMMEKIQEKTNIPIPDPGPFNLPLNLDEYGHLKEKQKEKYQAMKATI